MLSDLRVELERRTLVAVLQRHPEWRLADLVGLVEGDDSRAKTLRTLTLAELQGRPPPPLRVPIDRTRKARAMLATGPAFDRIVAEVVMQAGDWVASSYVGARVGGPRWKLQHSLGRLVKAGQVERRGRTSNTRYRRMGTRVDVGR